MKTQKETPGNVEQHDQNLGQDAEQYDKYQSYQERFKAMEPEVPATAKQFDTDKRSKLEEYDENMETLRLKMEDLIKEISEELMSGKLPNLAKEEAATNILNYYKKNLENQ